jgi:hypothetical protein
MNYMEVLVFLGLLLNENQNFITNLAEFIGIREKNTGFYSCVLMCHMISLLWE